jgi:hypothetical protein
MEVEEKAEHPGERGRGQERWVQGERLSVQQIPSPFIHSCDRKLTRATLGVHTPTQSTWTLTGGPEAHLLVNMGQLISEDSKGRHNDPRLHNSARRRVNSGTVATIGTTPMTSRNAVTLAMTAWEPPAEALHQP